MIHVLAFLARRPDLTRDAFRAHYEDVHVGVALPLLAGTASYVRHHIREELLGEPDFDCMTAFAYRDVPSMHAIFMGIAGAQGADIRADERRFMNKPANHFFVVTEGPGWQSDASEGDAERWIVCLRRDPAEAEPAFRARVEAALPELRQALAGARAGRVWWPIPDAARDARFDAVLELSADGPGALLRWCRAFDRHPAAALALRASRHETRVPAPVQ